MSVTIAATAFVTPTPEGLTAVTVAASDSVILASLISYPFRHLRALLELLSFRGQCDLGRYPILLVNPGQSLAPGAALFTRHPFCLPR